VTIHVALNHVTHYRFDRLVGLSPHLVRLRPAPHCRSPIVSYSLRVAPAKHFVNWQQDPQANYVARVVFPDRATELRVEVDLVAEMAVYNPFDFFLEPQAEEFPFKYSDWQARELAPYLNREPATPRFSEFLKDTSRQKQRTIDFLVALNARLARDVDTLSGWNRACRRRRKRWRARAGPAVTRRGC
jgi:transglutaminase-like putative cysteine protease